MKKYIVLSLLLGGLCVVSPAVAVEAEGTLAPAPAQSGGDWEAAGSEISEAAHAVSDATVESSKQAWESTKKGSAEAWEATKRTSKTAWEDGKAKVHEATAPAPDAEAVQAEAPQAE